MATPVKAIRCPGVRTNLLSQWQVDIDRMGQIFDEFWASRMPRFWTIAAHGDEAVMVPPIDLYKEGDEIVAKAEIPGIAKDDIEVYVTNSFVTISRKKDRKEVKKDYHYRFERSHGSFFRSVELPVEVQTEKAEATFKDGVLEIRIPKIQDAKRKVVTVTIK